MPTKGGRGGGSRHPADRRGGGERSHGVTGARGVEAGARRDGGVGVARGADRRGASGDPEREVLPTVAGMTWSHRETTVLPYTQWSGGNVRFRIAGDRVMCEWLGEAAHQLRVGARSVRSSTPVPDAGPPGGSSWCGERNRRRRGVPATARIVRAACGVLKAVRAARGPSAVGAAAAVRAGVGVTSAAGSAMPTEAEPVVVVRALPVGMVGGVADTEVPGGQCLPSAARHEGTGTGIPQGASSARNDIMCIIGLRRGALILRRNQRCREAVLRS